MDKPEAPDLLHVAASISDGVAVDWNRMNTPHDARACVVMREMALLERIASFHREVGESDTTRGDRLPGHVDAPEHGMWGHFRILEKIGEGTFGVVYRARDTKLDSEVALKLTAATESSSRILDEARRLARVRHPNVVRVHGTDQIDGRVGIWMEFVRGSTLANLLETHGPFGARETAGIGVDLCQGLAAVHGAGLMHGDIKAPNVMREAGGRTVLMDFGTGKDLGSPCLSKEHGSDDFAGTPLYVAPEVFEGQPRTRQSEIYSLGVLLFYLVTKQYPVEGHSRRELQQAHRRGERKHLRDARPDLPEDFIYVIERALSVNPSERYASAGAFEAALARLIGGARRSEAAPARWSALGLSIGIATLVVVAAGTYWLGHRWVGAPPSDPTAASRRSVGVPTVAATTSAAPELTYQIDLGLYRTRGNRQERVRPGERVTLGDQLFVKLRVSVPAYVYIVNEDDQGESYLLFPLPAQSVTNPVPAGTTNRIPGTGGSADVDWQVTSAGGHEHFLIFASPERLAALEQVFAALPRPELGKAMRSARLPEDAIRRLRGVGGLSAKPAQGNLAKLTPIFSTPLGEVEETAHGLWVRQLTVDNPVTSR